MVDLIIGCIAIIMGFSLFSYAIIMAVLDIE